MDIKIRPEAFIGLPFSKKQEIRKELQNRSNRSLENEFHYLQTLISDCIEQESKMAFNLYMGIEKKNRKREFVENRHIFFYFISKYSKRPFMYIGQKYGFNHATIIHSINNVKNWRETDPKFKKKLIRIKNKIILNYENN